MHSFFVLEDLQVIQTNLRLRMIEVLPLFLVGKSWGKRPHTLSLCFSGLPPFFGRTLWSPIQKICSHILFLSSAHSFIVNRFVMVYHCSSSVIGCGIPWYHARPCNDQLAKAKQPSCMWVHLHCHCISHAKGLKDLGLSDTDMP